MEADRRTRVMTDVGETGRISYFDAVATNFGHNWSTAATGGDLVIEGVCDGVVDLVKLTLGKMIYLGGSENGVSGFGLGELGCWRGEVAGAVRHRESTDLSMQRDKRQKEMKTLVDYKRRRCMDALNGLDKQAHGRVVPVGINIDGVNGFFISVLRRIEGDCVLGMDMNPWSVEDALVMLSVCESTRHGKRHDDETTNSWSGD
eukprot:CAMPEP_0194042474 /NCGR_PEP_ID=MMETSP0009_2-20130614/14247_1 /TAXON_ID=210454 /ORGANISM="Grammatophora oceanica, Strain CCMP 410" /LENGTH=202 /DNA_ID=CAMNT_0038686335 /DNA_START=1 /DNA_END=609 /DNA_ORIENTATION=+